ncbi:MAG: hypothetical protein PHF86_10620 [Candidatus Nanoarchaeia archaeon]|jgi:hypothetical protein|nr:hypothetical protein [Candidatus Nanoarchaeia archaeon]
MDNSDICKLEIFKAVEAFLLKTDMLFERKIRRWYSRTFFTPLKEVYNLSWQFILQNYYESLLEKKSYNEIIDLASQDLLTELIEESEKEADDFANSEELLEEQREGLNKILKKEEKIVKKPKIPSVNMKFDENN